MRSRPVTAATNARAPRTIVRLRFHSNAQASSVSRKVKKKVKQIKMNKSSRVWQRSARLASRTRSLLIRFRLTFARSCFWRKCFSVAPNSEIKIVKNWVTLSGLDACPLSPQFQRTTMRSIDDESLLDHKHTPYVPWAMSNAGRLLHCGGKRVRMRIWCSCRSPTLFVYEE